MNAFVQTTTEQKPLASATTRGKHWIDVDTSIPNQKCCAYLQKPCQWQLLFLCCQAHQQLTSTAHRQPTAHKMNAIVQTTTEQKPLASATTHGKHWIDVDTSIPNQKCCAYLQKPR
jgi:hypothetical protein